MPILGDSPELGALADYLDYLDVHDRNALGIAPAVPALVKTLAPAAVHAAMMLPTASQTLAPPPVQYAGQLTRTAPTQRLVAAMIPAGRALTVPFGTSRPTLVNPGAPADGSGLAPTMMAPPPNQQDVQSLLAPAPNTYVPASTGAGTSWSPNDASGGGASSSPDAGPPADAQQYQGASGRQGSSWGWLLLIAGGYYMWRSL